MTARELLSTAPPALLRRDGETLLLHLLGRDRAWLHAHPGADLSAEHALTWRELAERRIEGEPLQHLTGHQEFFGLDLLVSRDVLIPRPETEHLVEAVLAWARTQRGELQIVDVGTGSGAIALALLDQLTQAHVTAVDLSGAALEIARQNAVRLGLAGRLRLLRSDLLEVFAENLAQSRALDAIVSNPPYIPLGEAAGLAHEVREHEPPLALFAGKDGMTVYRRLVPAAAQALRSGGLLAMEFGFGQRGLMEDLFAAQPPGVWAGLRFTADLQGIPRVVEVLRGES